MSWKCCRVKSCCGSCRDMRLSHRGSRWHVDLASIISDSVFTRIDRSYALLLCWWGSDVLDGCTVQRDLLRENLVIVTSTGIVL